MRGILFVLMGGVVGALVVATPTRFLSAARATEVVDQAHQISGLALGQAVTSTRHFAQTFTADRAGLLSRVDLSMNKLSSATGNLLIGIRKVSGSGVPGTANADVLYETTVPVSSIASSSAFTLSVDLTGGGLLVNRGDVLSVAARRTTTVEEVTWSRGNPPYAGGSFYSRTGLSQSWTDQATDAGFQTWVDSAITNATTTLSATFDATAEFIGGGTPTLDSTTASFAVDRNTTFNSDRRGILEFPLSSLPANAVIRSARLDLDLGLYIESDPIFPIVSVHGYAGNGVLSVSDASVPNNQIGNSGPISFKSVVSIPLDAGYIQSLLGQSSHLGLLMKGEVDGYGVQFWSNELPTASRRPRLLVDYELGLTNSGDYDGNGEVDAADYTQWRDTRGQAVAAGAGTDGNGNGTIDAADYAFWKSRFGMTIGAGGTGTAQAPEPASAWLVALAAAAIGGWGRKRFG